MQAALLRAPRQLPVEMTTPPSYRKVNPADAPILLRGADLAVDEPLGAERLRREPDLADALDARRRGAGQRLRPEALRGARAGAARRARRAQHHARRAGQGAEARPTPTRRSARSTARARRSPSRPTGSCATRPSSPSSSSPAATARRCGWRTWPTSRTASSRSRPRAAFNGERSITLAVQRQPDANTVRSVDAIKAALPGFQAQMPQSVRIRSRSTTARSRSATRSTT